MTRVKICGITRVRDALLAAELGVDAIGLIFAPSPRQITIDQAAEIARALPPFLLRVGVFVDADPALVQDLLGSGWLDAAQLHGQETPRQVREIHGRVIKRLPIDETSTTADLNTRIRAYDGAGILLDPGAGDGRTFDWSLVRDIERPIILAGGLTPDNVTTALETTAPYAVDVASGVEAEPGIKDEQKLRAFLQKVRMFDAQHPA